MQHQSISDSCPDNKSPLAIKPINKLYIHMAMPMVFGMLINGIYNLVDAFFVASFIGSDAMASVSIAFPLQMIIIALAATISNGASVLLSQFLGANNQLKINALIAMNNAAQTIISFNHGAGHKQRVQQVFIYGLKANIKYLTVMACILLMIPGTILGGFSNDETLIAIGVQIARMMFALLPLAGFSFMTIAYFQGVGNAKQALLLSLTKVYFLILPLLLIINASCGYQKLWYAFPTADMGAVILACFLILLEKKSSTPLLSKETLSWGKR